MQDTLKGLELGAVETLIVWENLDISRITVRNNSSGEEKVLHLSKEQEQVGTYFRMPPGVELGDRQAPAGRVVRTVQDRRATPVHHQPISGGSQFCRGFGGIGGILRWRVDSKVRNMWSLARHFKRPPERRAAPPHERSTRMPVGGMERDDDETHARRVRADPWDEGRASSRTRTRSDDAPEV